MNWIRVNYLVGIAIDLMGLWVLLCLGGGLIFLLFSATSVGAAVVCIVFLFLIFLGLRGTVREALSARRAAVRR